MLASVLAAAPTHYSSDSNVEIILMGAGVVAVVAVLGFIPIQLSRVRGHKSAEVILGITILWGLLSAGSVTYAIMRQMNYSVDRQQTIANGDYDPTDTTGKPTLPILLWSGLAVSYAGTVAWAVKTPAAKTG